MKKIFSMTIVVALFLALAGTALAATDFLDVSDCQVPPDHGIYGQDGTELIGCYKADVWSKIRSRARSIGDLNNLPKVAPGETSVDRWGIEERCPFFISQGCVDISQTPEYEEGMLSLGRDLAAVYGSVSRAQMAYPKFARLVEDAVR